MTSRMTGDRCGLIQDTETGLADPLTEVDILKPHWHEPLIEAAHAKPRLSAEKKKGAGWLLGWARDHLIPLHASVMPAHRVARPKPIYPQDLENQGCGGG